MIDHKEIQRLLMLAYNLGDLRADEKMVISYSDMDEICRSQDVIVKHTAFGAMYLFPDGKRFARNNNAGAKILIRIN